MIRLFQQITSVTINDENAAFRDFMQRVNEGHRKYISLLFGAETNLLWSKSPQFSGQSGWLGGRMGKQGGRRFWKTDLGKQKTASQRNQEEGSECYPSVSEQSSNTAPYLYFSDDWCKGRRTRTRTTQNYQPTSTWLCVSDSIFWIYGLSKFFGISAMIFLESSVHGTRP